MVNMSNYTFQIPLSCQEQLVDYFKILNDRFYNDYLLVSYFIISSWIIVNLIIPKVKNELYKSYLKAISDSFISCSVAFLLLFVIFKKYLYLFL